MPNPYAPAETFVGLGPELVRGTAIVPGYTGAPGYVPVLAPDWTQNTKWLDDKGYRASMVEVYNVVEGVKHGEYSFQGNVFVDTLPHLLRGIVGSPDIVSGTATASPTVLSANAAAGALTISTAASIAATTVIQIGAGVTSELRTVQSVSGAGPYTITVEAGLTFSHLSSEVVTAVTSPFFHINGLLNNAAALGNQPPSYTLVDFYGPECRQFANCMFSEVTFTGAADGLVAYSAKLLGAPPTAITAPTASFTSTTPVPAWTDTFRLAGSTDATLMDFELSLKRTVTAKHTHSNSQSPYRIFAGPLSVSGKSTFIFETMTELNYFLNNTQPSMKYTFAPSASAVIEWQLSKVAYKGPPKINRGSDVVELEMGYDAVPNTTDATSGGVSPIQTKVTNLVSSAY